jgi:membrane protein YqaA with SNARE-associated domain
LSNPHKQEIELVGNPNLPGDVSILKWFGLYGLYLAALVVPLVLLIQQDPKPFVDMWTAFKHMFRSFKDTHFVDALEKATPAAKLLFMAVYLSIATTFIPLPTGAIVTLMAICGAGVSDDFLTTVLAVSSVGAVASMMANLTDYHVFLLLLRHKRVAKIRDARLYRRMAKWFDKSPFLIMLTFNIIHVPVDVPRMLAAAYGYARHSFAAANVIGRFVRYVIFTSLTFMLGRQHGWVAPVVVLALAALIGIYKLAPVCWQHFTARRTAAETSE